jgi:hypothetical protein
MAQHDDGNRVNVRRTTWTYELFSHFDCSHTLRTGGKGDDTTSKDMERHHNPKIWIGLSVSD